MLAKLIEAQVLKTPNNVAIRTRDRDITYNLLNQVSNRLARTIVKKSDSSFREEVARRVVLLFEHGPQMIIGLLGALKAGQVYVPLDPGSPEERLVNMIIDAGATLLVTDRKNHDLAEKLAAMIGNDLTILDIETTGLEASTENLDLSIPGDAIAYILYTSGSTGIPKGVIQTHKNVHHFVKEYVATLSITAEDRLTLFSAFNHDAAVMDIYSGLVSGATLYPVNIKNQDNIHFLVEWLMEEKITIWHSVPTVYRYIVRILNGQEEFSDLRFIVLGGEKLIQHDVITFQKRFSANTVLVNLYGQSESSFNSAQMFTKDSPYSKVTLGTPIKGVELLLIDEEGEEVEEEFQVGEIVINSDYIALGYWGADKRTLESFRDIPGIGRFYITGDLGRLDYDGKIEFVARKDFQVKIRGYRVEIGEIESSILSYTGVKEAVVVAKEDQENNQYLVAFVTLSSEVLESALKSYLLTKLPDYMIPSLFQTLDKMPLTSTNKTDRKALEAYEIQLKSSVEYVAPTSTMEKELAQLWSEVLDIDHIGLNDNFFALGGHSLKAAQLAFKINRIFKVKISLLEIFASSTLQEMAQLLEECQDEDYQSIPKVDQRAYYPVSFAQKRVYLINQILDDNTSYNMSGALEILGKVELAQLEKSFNYLIARHEALRTSFHLIDEEPVQVINQNPEFMIEYFSVSQDEVFNEVIKKIVDEFIRPFDLSKAPLIRVGVIKISEERHILLYDLHHIIADGTSMVILNQEFINVYNGIELLELHLQYKDYSVWNYEAVQQGQLAKQKEYWLEQYSGQIPELTMPLDFTRPEFPTFEGKTLTFVLSEKISTSLVEFATKNDLTLNMVLLSVYSILISKYTGQDDLIIGSLVAGRNHPDVQNVIGMFANFLPIRYQLNPENTCLEYMKMGRQILLSAYENQEYPFDQLVEELSIKAQRSKNPVFTTMLILHNEMELSGGLEIFDLEFSPYTLERASSKLDFKLDVYPAQEVRLSLEYNTNLFKEETMTIFGQHFIELVTKVINNPEYRISELEIFTPVELNAIKKRREGTSNIRKTAVPMVVSATFTAEPIADYILWWCQQFNIDIQIEFSPYNQVYQELLNPDSLLSKNTGVNLLLVRFEDWVRGDDSSDEIICGKLERNFRDFIEILEAKKKHVPYFIGVFPALTVGLVSEGVLHYIKSLQISFKETINQVKNLHLVDFTDLTQLYRLSEIFDQQKDQIGHLPFTDEFYAAMGTMVARKICGWQKELFKVIVLDLDNTLWKGICGEDGPKGVIVDEISQQLQDFMIEKHNEGFLLAICSKNNEQDVWEVFAQNPQMVLKQDHFVTWRINWQAKSKNLKEMAEELNLGLDSFIFIDDSPLECREVRTNAPEVLTVQLPEKHSQIPLFLKHFWAFDKFLVTEEDRTRSQMYLAERQRQGIHVATKSLTDFLEDLELKMSMRLLEGFQLERVAQLTQRTNQFNMSTIRRREEELLELIAQPEVKCWTIEVSDRFGDYGLIGVVITKEVEQILFIDTFLLSCRVLGRGVEDAILFGLDLYRQQAQLTSIQACFYPTPKNRPFKEFIERTDWQQLIDTGEYISYEIHEIRKAPDYIQFYYNQSYEKQSKTFSQGKAEKVFFTKLDHIAIAVENITKARSFYQDLGYKCTEAIYDPLQNSNLVLCEMLGADALELVAPESSSSPCIGILEKNGEVPYHLCYRVADQELYIEKLAEEGLVFEIISEAKSAILFGGKNVTFIHVKGVGLIELLEDKDKLEERRFSKRKISTITRLILPEAAQGIKFFEFMGYRVLKSVTDHLYNLLVITMNRDDSGKIELVVPLRENGKEYTFLENNGAHLYEIWLAVGALSEKQVRAANITLTTEVGYGILQEAPQIFTLPNSSYLKFYQETQNKEQFTDNLLIDFRIEDVDRMLHKAFILPLVNTTGAQLMKLPIYELNKREIIQKEYVAPSNMTEAKLVKIWSDILSVPQVGINDNFFSLGGHSLRATSLVSRIYQDFEVQISLRDIFAKPTIKEITELILTRKRIDFVGIKKVEQRPYYPVSSAQKRLFILNQLDKDSTNYNISGIIPLKEQLDFTVLENIINVLIERHEALRTSFTLVDGIPVQIVHDQVNFAIDYIELGQPTITNDLLAKTIKDYIRPFDLTRAPLLRVGLIKGEDDSYILVFDMHHIISDGMSMSILAKDFLAISQGRDLVALSIQYKDFASWQNQLLDSEKIIVQEQFWLAQFKGEIPILDLPTDYQRSQTNSFRGEQFNFTIDQELTDNLKKLANHNNATLFMVLLTSYYILLAKYSNQEDIIVGSPIAGRNHSDLMNIIGMFVNTLALRNYPEMNLTFTEFLQRVRVCTLESFENQDYQFETLVEKVAIQRSLNRNPLFDVMFVLQNIDHPQVDSESSSDDDKFLLMNQNVSRFDLTLHIREGLAGLNCSFAYSTDLFKKKTIERMTQHYINVITSFVTNPEIQLSEVEMISSEEKEQLLWEFNNTIAEYPANKVLQQIFEEQVMRRPDDIAVIFNDQILSYEELNWRANILAHALQLRGIQSESIVGLIVERSFEMLVGIFGILKAGGAYLPISPDYPRARMEYMLNDSGTELIVTSHSILTDLNCDIEILDLSECFEEKETSKLNPKIIVKSHNLAYIIYTSGSTGSPKGVQIEHGSVINTISHLQKKYPLEHTDVFLQSTVYTFDASVIGMFWWTFNGAKCSLLPVEIENSLTDIVHLIERQKITVIQFTPVMLKELFKLYQTYGQVDAGTYFKTVRYILVGGEGLIPDVLDEYHKVCTGVQKFINLYGPTETTINCTEYQISGEISGTYAPIGVPISNMMIDILDQGLKQVPIGVIGEIYISGVGLARGYLNNPELTREMFISNPLRQGQVMYKSGDLGRWLPDGNVEFIGRLDHQVKLRGFRIELREIESHLMKHEQIKEAIVVIKEDSTKDKYLAAYLALEREISKDEIIGYLVDELPNYMIPQNITILKEIPRLENGKVDRNGLIKLESTFKASTEYVAPETVEEMKLVKLWQEVLGVTIISKIGVNDNFFELGGNSLKAIILITKIQKEFEIEIKLRELFLNSTIKKLARLILSSSTKLYYSIKNVGKRPYYPVSSAQKRLFILNQLTNESTNYNINGVIPITGQLAYMVQEQVFKELIQRHETLRTSFAVVDGIPVQVVHDQVDFTIDYIDLSQSEKTGELLALTIKDYIRPFDLAKAPLLRVGLIKLEEDSQMLVFDMHHIIADGMSMSILFKDFAAISQGQELSTLSIQYKDFTIWQNQLLDSELLKDQEDFWLTKFKGSIPILDLPTDYRRPTTNRFRGNQYKFIIDQELTEKLRSLANQNNATLFMVLLATYNILLARYTNQEDIIIGSPIAGRNHPDLMNVIGMFVNTLALRNFPKKDLKFSEFLKTVRFSTLESFENQDYQFDTLVEKIAIPRNLNRNPLFDVMFVLQNIDHQEKGAEKSNLQIMPVELNNTKFDLTLNIHEEGTGLKCSFVYSTDLFEQTTIKRIAQHFINIVTEFLDNPEIRLAEVKMISREEKEKLLWEFNNTGTEYPDKKVLHQIFEEQVARRPDDVALILNDQVLSYKELNWRANMLAYDLKMRGVRSEAIIGLIVERSFEMVVGIYGILKAGCAYLPIASNYPLDRIEFILRDSGAEIIVASKRILPDLDYNGEILDLPECLAKLEPIESNPEIVIQPGHLAYVLYTSGSTGNPKGVLIEHGSVVNTISHLQRKYPLNHTDVILQSTVYTFDASVRELFWWAFGGAKCCLLPPKKATSLNEIINIIDTSRVTVIKFVPGMLKELLTFAQNYPGKHFSTVRYILVGGEALGQDVVNEYHKVFADGLQFINLYGPTEATIHCTEYEIFGEIPGIYAPLGIPISNMTVDILDQELRPVPIGVVGEICLGGKGLARGYLNNSELTYQRFVPNPLRPGEIMYRSGDLGRWLSDGTIEFMGRVDHQVKISGFRIELGEIETQLLKHDQIKEAVVVAREDPVKSKYLIAYLTLERELANAKIKRFLANKLPDYMVPTSFVILKKMPLTTSGKVDRTAFPEPNASSIIDTEYEVPTNEIEARLVDIWSKVLNIKKIGINDDFFSLGGHSLAAIRLLTSLYQEFQIMIPLVELFKNPTVKRFAQTVKLIKEFELSLSEPIVLLNDKVSSNLFCFPPVIGYGLVYKEFASLIKSHSVYGLDFIEEEHRIDQYVDLILKTQPEGPYLFLGYSAGANLAFAVAEEMEKKGYTVAKLIILDAPRRVEKHKLVTQEELDQRVDNFLNQGRDDDLINQFLSIEQLKIVVYEKVKNYMLYLDGIVNIGSIDSDIDLIISENSELTNYNWEQATIGKYQEWKGSGSHQYMLFGPYLNNNVAIIQKILLD